MQAFSKNTKLKVHKQSDTECPLCGEKGHRDVDGWVRHNFEEQADCWGHRKVFPKFEVDHIIPLNKSGCSGIENARLLCRRCNRAKRDRGETIIRYYEKGWRKIRVE